MRGLGLMVAAELTRTDGAPDPARTDGRARALRARDHLVLMSCGADGNVVRFMPPLVVSKEQIDDARRGLRRRARRDRAAVAATRRARPRSTNACSASATPRTRAMTNPASTAPSTLTALSSRNSTRPAGAGSSSATRSKSARSGFTIPSSNDRKRKSNPSRIGQRGEVIVPVQRVGVAQAPRGQRLAETRDERVGAGQRPARPAAKLGEKRRGLEG